MACCPVPSCSIEKWGRGSVLERWVYRGINVLTQWLGLLCFLSLSACQFIALYENIEKTKNVGSISGRIVEEIPTKSAVIVVVFEDKLKFQQVFNADKILKREYSIGVEPGNYFVGAFEDRNNDNEYQDGEPVGFYEEAGKPTLVYVGDGIQKKGIDIHISDDYEMPDLGDRDAGFPLLYKGQKNIGAIISLDNDRFSARNSKNSLWRPYEFSLEVGPGLFLLEHYDPNKIPVIFVHGLTGSPRDWQQIIDQIDRRRFQPWVLAYASGFEIDIAANYLRKAVNQLRIRYKFDDVYLVAHSMGGLVAKAYIDQFDHGKSVRLLVTLATPWGGHQAAQFGVDNSPVVAPVWVDMAPESAFLTSIADTKLPEQMEFYLFYGHNNDGLISKPPGDGTITLSSQLVRAVRVQAGADGVRGFNSSHTSIMSDDPVINELNRILLREKLKNRIQK